LGAEVGTTDRICRDGEPYRVGSCSASDDVSEPGGEPDGTQRGAAVDFLGACFHRAGAASVTSPDTGLRTIDRSVFCYRGGGTVESDNHALLHERV
jgi:hypothetical protein